MYPSKKPCLPLSIICGHRDGGGSEYHHRSTETVALQQHSAVPKANVDLKTVTPEKWEGVGGRPPNCTWGFRDCCSSLGEGKGKAGWSRQQRGGRGGTSRAARAILAPKQLFPRSDIANTALDKFKLRLNPMASRRANPEDKAGHKPVPPLSSQNSNAKWTAKVHLWSYPPPPVQQPLIFVSD